MKFITFMTYNQAVMYSRIERIVLVCAAAALVAFLDYSMNPLSMEQLQMIAETGGPMPYKISWGATMLAQLYVLKCWWDIMVMREPDKNCWEFKE